MVTGRPPSVSRGVTRSIVLPRSPGDSIATAIASSTLSVCLTSEANRPFCFRLMPKDSSTSSITFLKPRVPSRSIASTTAATAASPLPGKSTSVVCSRKYCRNGVSAALYPGKASIASRMTAENRSPCLGLDVSRVSGPSAASTSRRSPGVMLPMIVGSGTIRPSSNSSIAALPASFSSPVCEDTNLSTSRWTHARSATSIRMILPAFRLSLSTSRMVGAASWPDGSNMLEIASAVSWLSDAPCEAAIEAADMPAVIGSFSSCSSRVISSSALGAITRTMIGRSIPATASRSMPNFSAASTIACLNRAAASPPLK